MLDEPTTAMDVETRQAFCADMNAEGADGCTLLFATRYLEEADQAADRILVLNQGRLLAEGTPAQIKARAGAKRISFRLDHIDQPDPRFYGGVHLTAWKWLAIAGIIWLGALTFAALAVAIGYRFAPDTVQPVAMLAYFAMSILGGLWFALAGWMQTIGQGLPTYQITRIGTDLISGGTVPVTSTRDHPGLARRVHPPRSARCAQYRRDAMNPRHG